MSDMSKDPSETKAKSANENQHTKECNTDNKYAHHCALHPKIAPPAAQPPRMQIKEILRDKHVMQCDGAGESNDVLP